MATVTERLSVVETDLANHKEQCLMDKKELKDGMASMTRLLLVIAGTVILNLFVVIGYLVTEGTPWNKHTAAEVARR